MLKVLVILLFLMLPNERLKEPHFDIGSEVEWVDGSKGIVVSSAKHHEDGWHYHVKFTKSGMVWDLPECGLSSIIKRPEH